MVTSFKTTATVSNRGEWHHFGISPLSASLYGDRPEDIIEVFCEIDEDQSEVVKSFKELETADYWGFWDSKKDSFTLIYPQYFLLNMCFPYGISAEEERGFGKAYRLKVTRCS